MELWIIEQLSCPFYTHIWPTSEIWEYTFEEDIVMTFLVYACEGVEPHIQALHEI